MEDDEVLIQLFQEMEESKCREYMLSSMLRLDNPLHIFVIGHIQNSDPKRGVDTSRLIRAMFGFSMEPHGERFPGIVDAQWQVPPRLDSPNMVLIYQMSGRTVVGTHDEYVDQIKLFLDSRTNNIDFIWYVRASNRVNWSEKDSVIAHKLGIMLKDNYSEIPVMLVESAAFHLAVVENYEGEPGMLRDWTQCLEAWRSNTCCRLPRAMSSFLRSEGRMHEWLTWVISTRYPKPEGYESKIESAGRLIADVVVGSEKAVSEKTAASLKALFCHRMLQQLFTAFHKMLARSPAPYDTTPDGSFVSPPFLNLVSKAAPGSVSKILLLYSVYTLGCTIHYLAQQATSDDSVPKPAPQDFSALWSAYGKSRAAKRDWGFGCKLLRDSCPAGYIVLRIRGHFESTSEIRKIRRASSNASLQQTGEIRKIRSAYIDASLQQLRLLCRDSSSGGGKHWSLAGF